MHTIRQHIVSRHGRRAFSTDALLTAQVLVPAGGLAVTLGTALFAGLRYRVCQPGQYLARTGPFIADIDISKQSFQWPFQTATFISMEPQKYMFSLQAKTQEGLDFTLPGVYTIGPKDTVDGLKRFARLLVSDSKLHEKIEGIIEGETRMVAGNLTIDQIFNDRNAFKHQIAIGVQKELDHFGLAVHNANIQELTDPPNSKSKYFEYRARQKSSEAENKAYIDVAEQKRAGDIGSKKFDTEAKQQVGQLEANTVKFINERKQEMARSDADLKVLEQSMSQNIQMATIDAQMAVNKREVELRAEIAKKNAELQADVERQRIDLEIQRMRAAQFSVASVQAEITEKEAQGRARAAIENASGEAEAIRRRADAELYAKQKQAEGLLAIKDAEAKGNEKVVASFGGDRQVFLEWLAIHTGTTLEVVKAKAEGFRGMQPKFTNYYTGDKDGNGGVTLPQLFNLMPMAMDQISTYMATSSQKVSVVPHETGTKL